MGAAGTLHPMTGYALRYFGDPVLKQPARVVEELTDDLVPLVHGMYDTMAQAEGVGLAAPQVGRASCRERV